MIVELAFWNLAESKTNVAELREWLRREGAEHFERTPGLLFASWLSDEVTERWGGIWIWESATAADQSVPSRAPELIGADPVIQEAFELEATASPAFELSRLGLAFENS
jgi:hypothetical protein